MLCVLALCPQLAAGPQRLYFTRYDLEVTLDPHQHGLSAEGTVELRNTSKAPQREAVLQISSSLHWLSVLADGEEVEWLEQTYTSDIDHTGRLNEAIVKLDKPLAPGESLRLNVRYSGTVPKDTTRLERIGTPPQIALRSDWDEISDGFTALRGAGFVVWYPVSMDAANLSQGNELFEILARWREREASAVLRVQLSRTALAEGMSQSSSLWQTAAEHETWGRQITAEFHDVDPVIALLDDPGETTDRPRVAAYLHVRHTRILRATIWRRPRTVIPPIWRNGSAPPEQSGAGGTDRPQRAAL